ncbi:MAG: Sir2 family NAD-dependent protein deacetylase [Candidatus Aminicenantales bacterium]
MTDAWQEKIAAAASWINEAEALLVCAGAGMGVDSGLPDFRGRQGFWNAYPPYRKLGLDFYELANPEWFHSDPALAWGFYGHRLNLYRQTIPHPGFALLLAWSANKSGGYFVFTSNVDGQFQKIGFDAERVSECHGSIHHLQCMGRCADIWPAAEIFVEVHEENMRAQPPLPSCPNCGQLARPNVMMFGDWNWQPRRSQKQHYRFSQWLEKIEGKNLVIVECGAGTAVPSVRSMAERLLLRPHTRLIRINAREADVPAGQIGLAGGALATLTEIQHHSTSFSDMPF